MLDNDLDTINFLAEDEEVGAISISNVNPWKVLIVDDDPSVHDITEIILRDLIFENKNLAILHAYSAEESKKILADNGNIALIFLDVVMENETAGLDLIKHIRAEMNNSISRIILRTGQPGSAPEKSVIIDYDINDYKLKTELTADKLLVVTITALRSFRDLEKLENNRRSLEKIVSASNLLLKHSKIEEFLHSVTEQFVAMAKNETQPHIQQISGIIAEKKDNQYFVESCTPDFIPILNKTIDNFMNEHELALIKKAEEEENILQFKENILAFYFKSRHEFNKLFLMKKHSNYTEIEKEMYSIFLNNICIALDNIQLGKEMETAQKEMIFMLGEVAELRSRETSFHVKRVAEYSKLLAIKYGLSKEDAELLKMAAPLHDIGKIAVSDLILNKPGKLTEEEFDIMRTHTTIGYEMLINSKGNLMVAAANIAMQHHEKYDGSGYPNHLKGEEISIFSRIVAVTDVFDALGSKRVYKEAWPLDNILKLFENEKGKHFDPKLTDILLNNIDDFIEIREAYVDNF